MSTGPTAWCASRSASSTAVRSSPTGRAAASHGMTRRSSVTGYELFDQLADLGHDRVGRGVTLEQHVDLLGRDPVGPLADHAVEALADTVDLAALHRQKHVGRGGKAGNELELGAEHSVERLRIGVGAGADAGVADDQL